MKSKKRVKRVRKWRGFSIVNENGVIYCGLTGRHNTYATMACAMHFRTLNHPNCKIVPVEIRGVRR